MTTALAPGLIPATGPEPYRYADDPVLGPAVQVLNAVKGPGYDPTPLVRVLRRQLSHEVVAMEDLMAEVRTTAKKLAEQQEVLALKREEVAALTRAVSEHENGEPA